MNRREFAIAAVTAPLLPAIVKSNPYEHKAANALRTMFENDWNQESTYLMWTDQEWSEDFFVNPPAYDGLMAAGADMRSIIHISALKDGITNASVYSTSRFKISGKIATVIGSNKQLDRFMAAAGDVTRCAKTVIIAGRQSRGGVEPMRPTTTVLCDFVVAGTKMRATQRSELDVLAGVLIGVAFKASREICYCGREVMFDTKLAKGQGSMFYDIDYPTLSNDLNRAWDKQFPARAIHS